MTELSIENNLFYLLEAGENKAIFDSEDSAVSSLKGLITAKTELDDKNVSIVEVDISGDKWSIKQIPWSTIAMRLIRGG